MAPELEYITISPGDLRDLAKAGIGKEVIASLVHDWARSVSRHRQSKVRRPVLLLQNKFKRLCDESLGSQQVAELLRVGRRRVRQLAAPNHPGLYAFRGLNEEWQYPPWQFLDGKPLPHLRELLKAINPNAHPVTVYRFMTKETSVLESPRMGHRSSPREWLIAGYEPEPVLQLARDL